MGERRLQLVWVGADAGDQCVVVCRLLLEQLLLMVLLFFHAWLCSIVLHIDFKVDQVVVIVVFMDIMVIKILLLVVERVAALEAEVVVRHEAVGVREWVLARCWRHRTMIKGILLVGNQVLLLHFQ